MLHYILGFLSGIIFLSLLIIIFIFFLKNKEKIEENELLASTEEIDEEVKEIVLKYKKDYLKLNTFGFEGNLEKLKNISLNLSKEIAKKYYPKSPYPYLELEFYQLLKLNLIMTNYLLGLLENSKFDKIKYAKISTLMNLKENKESLTEGVKKIGLLKMVYKSPLGIVLGKIGADVGISLGLEVFFKFTGSHGIEKLGKELNRLYSGHYIDEDKKS